MRSGFAPVHNRYVLPFFVERSSNRMMKETDPYNKMFEDRIIFLGVEVDDASANDVMAQLPTLESSVPDRDSLIISNCGRLFHAMTAAVRLSGHRDQAREILRMRIQLEEMISSHSGQPIEKVRKDIDRDQIMAADEAKEYEHAALITRLGR